MASHGFRQRAILCYFTIPAVFAAQLLFVSRFGEPYPALMLPRFGAAGPVRGAPVELKVAEVSFAYADQTTLRVTPKSLLSQIPSGHHGAVMQNLLAPPGSHLARGKLAPPTWLFPGWQLARRERGSARHEASLKAWLRERATSFHRGSTPLHCTIFWHTYAVHMAADGSLPFSTLAHEKATKVERFDLELGV